MKRNTAWCLLIFHGESDYSVLMRIFLLFKEPMNSRLIWHYLSRDCIRFNSAENKKHNRKTCSSAIEISFNRSALSASTRKIESEKLIEQNKRFQHTIAFFLLHTQIIQPSKYYDARVSNRTSFTTESYEKRCGLLEVDGWRKQ